MHRFAMMVGLMGTACSGAPQPPTTNNGSAAGPALYAKKMSLAWAFQPSGPGTEVFVETTDETGKQVSYSLGTFDGDCKPHTPTAQMQAVMGVACTGGGTAVELHAVVHDREVVILKLRAATDANARPDPMSREEVKRIVVPPGTGVHVGS